MEINNKLEAYKMALTLSLMIIAINTVPEFAYANSTSDGVSDVLCRVVNMLTGTAGKAISIIGICVLGIGLFMGKLSWPLALATSIGIGLIFSASNIVNWLSGSQAASGSCSTS